jgi:hypothetical protein
MYFLDRTLNNFLQALFPNHNTLKKTKKTQFVKPKLLDSSVNWLLSMFNVTCDFKINLKNVESFG